MYRNYIYQNIIKEIDDNGGVRTHEAFACELKSHPFDHSGTLSCTNQIVVIIKRDLLIVLLYLVYIPILGIEPRLKAQKALVLSTTLYGLFFINTNYIKFIQFFCCMQLLYYMNQISIYLDINFFIFMKSGSNWFRTNGLLINSQTLYLLSYRT